MNKQPLVQYLDQTEALDCPYGQVQRVVTGGAGGVANVHVVEVTRGTPHLHQAYDEVYYVLSGAGTLQIEAETYPLRPGAVAVIPAQRVHSIEADGTEPLRFIIFGTPPCSLDDPAAKPQSP